MGSNNSLLYKRLDKRRRYNIARQVNHNH
jgi:hypothetical protein